VAPLGGDEERIPGPVLGGEAASVLRRPHRLRVDPGMLPEEIDPPERGLHLRARDLRARDSRDRDPPSIEPRERLGGGGDLVVLADQPLQPVIDGNELVGTGSGLPCLEGEDVVARPALRLRGDGAFVLPPHRGDDVDLHSDARALSELGAEVPQSAVSRGHPVVPEAAAQRHARLAVPRPCGERGGSESANSGLKRGAARNPAPRSRLPRSRLPQRRLPRRRFQGHWLRLLGSLRGSLRRRLPHCTAWAPFRSREHRGGRESHNGRASVHASDATLGRHVPGRLGHAGAIG